jgi:hypothetical protein
MTGFIGRAFLLFQLALDVNKKGAVASCTFKVNESQV